MSVQAIKRIKALEAALRPFADLFMEQISRRGHEFATTDHTLCLCNSKRVTGPNVQDLRRAAAALHMYPEPLEKENE